MTAEIGVEELDGWRRSGKLFTLLDVREPSEIQTASLPNAVHIPMREIPVRFGEVPADHPIVVMCHHGGRSERVAIFLASQGLADVFNLEGGIDAWSRRIDPSVPTY